ncbi:hypothetical protein N7475_003115 [Penicillium sp. IBT 31633x]|nr:hypothetical protein N7475_003115 [Penicillium sp. IBT 31633x]
MLRSTSTKAAHLSDPASFTRTKNIGLSGMNSSPPLADSGLTRPRPRPRRACGECRKRKRRCDGDFPCSTCIRYSYTCQYENGSTQRVARAVRTPVQMRSTARSTPTPQHIPVDRPVPTRETEQETGFLEREKARFLSHASSISQARFLGLGLGLSDPPRLHSFGYHTGIRQELDRVVSIQLSEIISWDKASSCIDVFTSVIHPIFGFMNMEYIYQRAQGHWQGIAEGSSFGAVIGGVIALGSLFSNNLGEEKELEVILHVKSLLDDPVISRRPSQDLVMAWILRTIYSRATTRPNVAWLQSATTLHLIEITGLHRNHLSWTSSVNDSASDPHDNPDTRARITSVAQSLHVMIAYDYGKSIVQLDPAIYSHIKPRPGDFTLQLSELTNKVSTPMTGTDPISKQGQLLQAMEELMEAAVDHDFLLLARAELCFAIHRRHHILGPGISKQQTKFIAAAGIAALPAARRSAAQHHPWWNVTNALFQFVCVCLSIGTTEAITNIQPTIETFASVIQRFNTHLVQEAFSTVRILVDACLAEKEKQVTILRRAQDTQSINGTLPREQGDLSLIDPQVASLFDLNHESPYVDFSAIFNM